MNKREAYIAMEQGKKITHMYFDDDEFLYIKDGTIYTEDNYKFDNRDDGYDGWKSRDSEAFQTGWNIFIRYTF